MNTPVDTTASTGRSWRRPVLAAILAVVLIIFAAGIYLLSADLGRFRGAITDAVSTATGREFRVAGELDIELGRTIDIYAEGVTLADAPWSGDEPMLSIGAIRLSVRTASLFSGPLVILDAEVRDADVRIATDDAGRSNWILGEEDDAEPARARDLSPPALLQRMHAENIDIEIQHPALQEPIEIAVRTADHDVVDDRVLSRITGSINGEPLEFDNDLGPRTNFWRAMPVDFVLHGRLGEVALQAEGQLDDLLAPERPVVTAKAEGPSVEYLLDVLNLPPLASGPLRLDFHLEPLPERVTIRADGTIGEYMVDVDGWVSSFDMPESMDLSFRARGPDIGRIGHLLGTSRLPASPFELSGSVARDAATLRLQEVELRVGTTLLALSGVVRTFLPPSGEQVVLELRGDDIGDYRALLGVPGELEGPFYLRAGILQPEDEIERVQLSGNVGAVTHTLTIYFDDSPDLSGERVDFVIEGPDASTVGKAFAYDKVPALPFRAEGSAQYTGEFIDVTTSTVSLGSDRLRISGRVDPAFPEVAADLDISVAVADAGTTGRALGYEGLPSASLQATGSVAYTGGRLDIRTATVSLGRDEVRISGAVRPELPNMTADLRVAMAVPQVGATLSSWGHDGFAQVPANARMRVQLDRKMLSVSDLEATIGNIGLAGRLSADLDAPASSASVQMRVSSADPMALFGGPSTPALSSLPLTANIRARSADDRINVDVLEVEWGDSRLEAHGVIDRPPDVQATRFEIRAHVPSLAALARRTDHDLPDVPLTVEGSLAGTREAITGSDIRIGLGDSRATLDVAYRPEGAPVIDLRLESPYVDVRPLVAAPAPEPEPPAATTKPAPGRLIPDASIPVEQLQDISVHAYLHVEEWVAAVGRFRDVRLDATLIDGALVVEQFGALGARGDVSGSLSYKPVNGDYRLEAEVAGERFLFAAPDRTPEQIEAAPRFDIESRLTGTGTTVHGLLGSLDGLLIMSGSPGEVPTTSGWLANMITGDFMYQVLTTVNPFVKQQNTVRMECAVLLLNADSGKLSGDPFLVLQTDRLNLFVKGKIDLSTEAMDIDINTQQRKGLGISIGEMLNPYTKITGTLSEPRLVVDPKGTLVEGGAAALTGGLTLIAKGLKGRFFSNPKPCDAALEAYRKAREEVERNKQREQPGQ